MGLRLVVLVSYYFWLVNCLSVGCLKSVTLAIIGLSTNVLAGGSVIFPPSRPSLNLGSVSGLPLWSSIIGVTQM